MSFDDICYLLFRHKWKILFLTLLGVAAATGVYLLTPRLYQSEAKIMVKYITEIEPLGASESDGQVRSPVLRGETVVNSELEILTSMDLAMKVAEAVGPERILAKLGGGRDMVSAALVVNSGTKCDVPRRGNVIVVAFQHPDPAIVQPVLSNLVDQYTIKHFQIHRALASLDDFAQQRESVKERLHKTEQSLIDLKKTNGVFSIEAAKRAASDRVARVEQELGEAETDLATRQAALKAMVAEAPKEAPERDIKDRSERRERYSGVIGQLQDARRRKLELSGQFVAGSPMVEWVEKQIADLEKEKKQLEKDDPTLLQSVATTANGNQSLDNLTDPTRLTVLQARVEALKASLARAKAEEAKLYEVEAPIVRLQRTKDLEESKYRYLSSSLETAQIDSGLGASRLSNISTVQQPTPPRREIGALYKRMMGCAAGGLFAGLFLALLMEFFVDQSVKRSTELQRLVPAPLFMSIPRVGPDRAYLPAGKAGAHQEYLQPFVEALRDRILNRFENLARKPKLVGVCGCVAGSGVTSIAAGLAASLSESGDLKVLLVDMKRGKGRPHPLLHGGKSCSLIDVLEGPKRQEALIGPNLYLASAHGTGAQQVMSSPRKFTSVVPQLNTSDYDYIVFDMPPVDQVSSTPRLAKHMDLTLLVVEAEKASRSRVKQAGSLLLEFTQNVAVVLNKTRNYLPGRLSEAA